MHVGPPLTRDRRDHHCQAKSSMETWFKIQGPLRQRIRDWKVRVANSQLLPITYPIIRIWCLVFQRVTWARIIKHLISWLRMCSKMKMWGNLTVYSWSMLVLAMSYSPPISNLLTSTWTEWWIQWVRIRRTSPSSQVPSHLGAVLSQARSDLNSRSSSRMEEAKTWETV